MPPFFSVTQSTHARLATHLRAADAVIDATCGNGHDSLALAALVGPTGQLLAIDCQRAALDATRAALDALPAATQPALEFIEGDHATVLQARARSHPAAARAVLFNLGYLPGGNKTITTRTTSTLPALEAAWTCLAPGGVLAVVCYPGHDEGAREAMAVEKWIQERAATAAATLERVAPGPTRRPAPFLLWLARTDT